MGQAILAWILLINGLISALVSATFFLMFISSIGDRTASRIGNRLDELKKDLNKIKKKLGIYED